MTTRAKMREALAGKLKGYQQFEPFVYMLLYSPREELTKFLDAAVKAGMDFAEAERARCANLADAEYDEQAKLAAYHKGEGDFEAMDRRTAAAVVAAKIAAAIRNPLNT